MIAIYEKTKSEIQRFGAREVAWHILYKGFHSQGCYTRMLEERDKCYLSMEPEEIKRAVAEQYVQIMREPIDIDEPKTFNQKIQWLKIYDTTPEKTRLADKYLVREWIQEQIGQEYLIPLLGVWKSADAIDFDTLPERFCLKANHGSGMNYVVEGKSRLTEADKRKIRKMADGWMRNPFHAISLEFQYRDIPRRIIAEKYIEEMDGNLYDYKIHCFHGEPKIIQLIGDRNLSGHTAKEAYFDTEWNRNDLMYNTYDQYVDTPEKPGNLDEMLRIARVLSRDFIYVRVDLYDIDGEIKFGEMTFTPAAGYGTWGGGIFRASGGRYDWVKVIGNYEKKKPVDSGIAGIRISKCIFISRWHNFIRRRMGSIHFLHAVRVPAYDT